MRSKPHNPGTSPDLICDSRTVRPIEFGMIFWQDTVAIYVSVKPGSAPPGMPACLIVDVTACVRRPVPAHPPKPAEKSRVGGGCATRVRIVDRYECEVAPDGCGICRKGMAEVRVARDRVMGS